MECHHLKQIELLIEWKILYDGVSLNTAMSCSVSFLVWNNLNNFIEIVLFQYESFFPFLLLLTPKIIWSDKMRWPKQTTKMHFHWKFISRWTLHMMHSMFYSYYVTNVQIVHMKYQSSFSNLNEKNTSIYQ